MYDVCRANVNDGLELMSAYGQRNGGLVLARDSVPYHKLLLILGWGGE